MKKLLIFGLSSIGELAHFYFTHDSDYQVAGFTVDAAYHSQTTFQNLPVVAWEEAQDAFPPAEYDLFVALGYVQLNRLRTLKVQEGEAKGYSLANYLSSKAIVFPGFEPKPNQFILENNIIQPFATIGKNVTLWSGNHIGHHSTIEDNCFIASHVVVSGHVTVGAGSFVGINATIRDNITIGKSCLIGAGALILHSTGDDELFPGKATEKSIKSASSVKRI